MLRTGDAVIVASPGDLTLKAASAVEVGDGLEVAAGGKLIVE